MICLKVLAGTDIVLGMVITTTTTDTAATAMGIMGFIGTKTDMPATTMRGTPTSPVTTPEPSNGFWFVRAAAAKTR